MKNIKICCSLLLIVNTFISCSSNDTDLTDPGNTVTEKIYYGNVELMSQSELNTFASQNYDRIQGGLFLVGDNVVDASGLSSIKHVKTALSILGTSLESLNGLENINLTDGAFIDVINNSKLVNIDALTSINAEISLLNIRDNAKLIGVNGLTNVTSVTHNIDISNNPELLHINGLSQITSSIVSLDIRNNDKLLDINGIKNISQITHNFALIGNGELVELPTFSSLRNIKELNFTDNVKLENITGLAELEICSDIVIQNNLRLKNLDGFVKLRENQNQVKITGNIALRDFCGLTLLSTLTSQGYNIRDNFFNPTREEIKNGNCSI